MKTRQSVIGVNLEVPNIQIGKICNNKLENLIETQIDQGESQKFILNKIADHIGDLMSEDVVGIGIGLPGLIDLEKNIVTEIHRIPSWKNVNVKSFFENKFNVPCYINNDANCFALGVKYFGKGNKCKNVIGLIVGEGFGAGLIIDNKLFSGGNCAAGEFGMIKYLDQNVEYYSSALFFKNVHKTSFTEILRKARKGDKKALKIFNEYGHHLGSALQNIILSVNPELIIIGGIVRDGFEFYKKAMWGKVNDTFFTPSTKGIRIEPRALPNLAVLGAAALYYDEQQAKVLEIEKQLRTQAEKEIENLLKNVEEGIFIIKNSLKFGSQYSAQLETILESKRLADKNFINFLKNKISNSDITTTKNYLEMMFDDSLDEKMIEELNPLDQIKVRFNESAKAKELMFSFKRIRNKNMKTTELFTMVKDITKQVELENKVKESEIKAKRQTEWVLAILKTEPVMMRDFIEGIQNEFQSIDSIFESAEQNKQYEPALLNIYSSMHLIKGNASMLDFSFFADNVHQFENKISDVLSKKKIMSKDLIELVNDYSEIKNAVYEIKEFLAQVGKLNTQIKPESNPQIVKSLENFVDKMAKEKSKKIILQSANFLEPDIPKRLQILVKDISIQLIRNSVAHGIESPKERNKMGKEDHGTLTLKSKKNQKQFSFSIHDDGRGIQIDKLKTKMQQKKEWKDINLDTLPDNEIYKSMFLAGISTSEKTDMNAGRGIGLDAVLKKVEGHNGTIEVESKQNKYCKFSIVLPLSSNN
ncbi:MAG: ROK family protein [Calditrichaeota bacterium]|nr:MAG: ROK family protein [Calditrichota bacterium]MBL1206511.1 ROK family protein [Calditrichota bacterium]NOG46339.1 ROK family protein [Calditrichota bacterium]